MGRPRLPQDKAEVSGAVAKNAGRFAGRKTPKSRPVGDPYQKMSPEQCHYWQEFKKEMPWLTSSDRVLLRLACIWTARLDEPEDDARFGVSATQALSSILSKLGATPSDKTKVSIPDADDTDPEDEFFGVSH